MSENPYPPHVLTLQEAVAKIRETLGHPDLRCERFDVSMVTSEGHTLRMKWDRRDVGQRPSTEFAP